MNLVEMTSAPSMRSRIGISLPILVGLTVFCIVLGAGSAFVLQDPDTYMHVTIGRWIIAHHAVPHIGILSETMPTAPWVAHEWLAATILAALYNAWGWNGPVLATAFFFAAALAILTRILLRYVDPVYALAGMMSAWMMMLRHLFARPHILALPIVVLWFAVLIDARARNRAPPIWLVPLMTLWANLHGGYIVGLAFVPLFAGEALLTAKTSAERLMVVKQWGLFGVFAIAACLITPFGVKTLWLPFHVIHMKFATSVLGEWQSPNFQHLEPLDVWLIVVLALILGFGVRLPLSRIVMLLLLLHMSLAHQRNGDLLGFVAPLLVAQPVSTLLRASRRNSVLDRLMVQLSGRTSLFGGVAAAIILSLVTVVYIRHPVVRPEEPITPATALVVARADHLTGGRVFNEYAFGGYLLFSGVAPFIDGRAELYGDAFIKQYWQALTGANQNLSNLLDAYHISWAILSAQNPGVSLMDHLPGWRLVYIDRVAAVFARTGHTP